MKTGNLLQTFAIISGFAKSTQRTESGEMDEWFKSHAWKACIGS